MWVHLGVSPSHLRKDEKEKHPNDFSCEDLSGCFLIYSWMCCSTLFVGKLLLAIGLNFTIGNV
jgi:hypothetical protein